MSVYARAARDMHDHVRPSSNGNYIRSQFDSLINEIPMEIIKHMIYYYHGPWTAKMGVIQEDQIESL